MAKQNPLERAAALAPSGWTSLGKACGVTYMAVQKWSKLGRLPMPCLLGFQNYHYVIAAVVDNQVTAEELLAWSYMGHAREYGISV